MEEKDRLEQEQKMDNLLEYLSLSSGTNASGIPMAVSMITFASRSPITGETFPQDSRVFSVPVLVTYSSKTISLSFDFTEDDTEMKTLVMLLKRYEDDCREYVKKSDHLITVLEETGAKDFFDENFKKLLSPSVQVVLMPYAFNGQKLVFTIAEPQTWLISSVDNEINKFPRLLTLIFSDEDFDVEENSNVSISEILRKSNPSDEITNPVMNNGDDENTFSRDLMNAALNDGMYDTNMMNAPDYEVEDAPKKHVRISK